MPTTWREAWRATPRPERRRIRRLLQGPVEAVPPQDAGLAAGLARRSVVRSPLRPLAVLWSVPVGWAIGSSLTGFASWPGLGGGFAGALLASTAIEVAQRPHTARLLTSIPRLEAIADADAAQPGG